MKCNLTKGSTGQPKAAPLVPRYAVLAAREPKRYAK